MGRRQGRKLTRAGKAQGKGVLDTSAPHMIACGRIRAGVSETYIAFRAMPTADKICSTAIRKVKRALRGTEALR